ncbi:glycosyltransferase family protein [Cellulomonas pakistanensis]|uniref:Membrane protein n=1 Tax=Cellulomonas pakistanensis TaxID=992287 RepID=A0A919P6K5_9CELL|nr:glycosyltransferase [Cellulomonas pakistanensis]GIG35220.1 membrane protein [Cellulomonas pakistanensis]
MASSPLTEPSGERRGPARPAGRPRRIALYSHDTQGLGHIRRNIALAAALVADDPATDVLLLTGAPEATGLPLPPRTDVVTLPTLRKDGRGRYAARTLGSTLPEVIGLRSRILAAALSAFAPDLLVVDKVARGVDGELDAALAALRGTGTAVVLGLREVLDTPEVARREWAASRTTETVRDLYDAVWVYGDRAVYDLVAECRLPAAVAAKVAYTGYLARGRGAGTVVRSRPSARVRPPAEPYVLCLVGGGQDGRELAEAFARAPLPAGHGGVLLTGPYMRRESREALRRAAEGRPDLAVLEFVPDADRFVAGASAVVSMAGYNSVCELLAAGRRTLLVPRTTPRAEQMLRARSLERVGLVDVLAPEEADADRLGAWLRAAARPAPVAGRPVDLDGLARVPRLAADLIAAGPAGAARPLELADVAV